MFKPPPYVGEPPSLIERRYVAEDPHFPQESRMLASHAASVQVVLSPVRLDFTVSEWAAWGGEGLAQEVSSSVQKINSPSFTPETMYLWPAHSLKMEYSFFSPLSHCLVWFLCAKHP